MRSALIPSIALLIACGEPYEPYETYETYEPHDAYDLRVQTDAPYDYGTQSSLSELGYELDQLTERVELAAADVDGSYGYALSPRPGSRADAARPVRSSDTRQLSGRYDVTSVPTDRGFWMERDGQEVFVLLKDAPSDADLDIDPGQTLQIRAATVRTPDELANVEGKALDRDTKRIARSQDQFWVVDESDVRIVARN